MSLNHANNISVAFDDFGRYVETVSGKDTLIGVAFDYFHRLVETVRSYYTYGSRKFCYDL